MNPFLSDKAPYAIGLLISALGWAFAALHGGLQDSLIVSYGVRRHGEAVVATITNLSKTKSVGPVRFMLACEGQVACLARNGDETRFAMRQPTGIAGGLNEFENASDLSIEFTVALPPGGSIGVQTQTSNATPVLLLLTPDAVKPEPIYMLARNSPVAWFISRYYLLTMTLATAFLAGFVAWLVHGLLKTTRLSRRLEEGTPTDGPAQPSRPLEPFGDTA